MPDPQENAGKKNHWLPDFLASAVVFLVALPLCIGIAVACGVPVELGLITGIIGGIVVGRISGAPLLVSGPAASLIVPVTDLIRDHGFEALAPVVVLAGLWQVVAGVLKLGRWFRAVAPAVILGMLIGIGVLILASQVHVCFDADPQGSFVDNVLGIPSSIVGSAGRSTLAPFLISATTILLIVVWSRIRPKALGLVPGQLVGLLAVTIATLLLGTDVAFLDISPRFFDGLAPTTLGAFGKLGDPKLIMLSFVFAFVASAATLLTANAIDQRQTRSKADYDREMLAQGVGNILTGGVGGLPMTGVIVRSSVNVDAGAQTRWSTIMHGVWILLFVSAAPEALELIPKASLGAILVYTGYKLMDYKGLAALYRQGRAELGICLVTLFGVVFVDLFIGILAGLAVSVFKIVYTFARLEIRSEPHPSRPVQELHLTGSATFLQLPHLARALDETPADRELHVHIDRLDHIDHACLQLLSSWNQRRESEGRAGMVVEWDELTERYRKALVGGGAREQPPGHSIAGLVWEEWRRVYATGARGSDASDPWQDFIDESRTRVQVQADSLDDVAVAAAEALAAAAERPAAELAEALRSRIEGHVALGGGVSVPHTPIQGLERSLAALVTTTSPVEVAGEQADVFFVLLAPSEHPRKHLQALAHVGRLCHDPALLGRLREARTTKQVANLLRAVNNAVVDTDPGVLVDVRLLGVVEVEDAARAQQLARLAEEAFGRVARGALDGGEPFRTLRRVLRLSRDKQVLLVALEERDVPVLDALLEEEQRLTGRTRCPVHLMRPDALARRPEGSP